MDIWSKHERNILRGFLRVCASAVQRARSEIKTEEGKANKNVIHPRNCAFSARIEIQWCSRCSRTHVNWKSAFFISSFLPFFMLPASVCIADLREESRTLCMRPSLPVFIITEPLFVVNTMLIFGVENFKESSSVVEHKSGASKYRRSFFTV